LADFGTKSYIVGSTNSLLLQQRDRYSDILINLDEESINITSTSLRNALQLSVADRRWMDFITQNVNETWDKSNPGRPKTMGYVGSEEFIRLQFEEYLLSMISAVKYHNYLLKHANNPRMALPHIEGDPSSDFSTDWVEAWMRTENYRIWNANTDSHIFDIVEPKHPCAGGLTIDDVQRRISQQVQDLHLDERLAQGREVLGRNLAAGRDKASSVLNKLYADMEALREAQRKRAEEARAQADSNMAKNGTGSRPSTSTDAAKSQQTTPSVGVKAGAFVNSWAAWAGEKRKAAGWGRAVTGTNGNGSATNAASAGVGSNGGSTGSWVTGWGKSNSKSRNSLAISSDTTPEPSSMSAMRSPRYSTPSPRMVESSPEQRPLTRGSFSESILDAAGSESGFSSHPASPQPAASSSRSGPWQNSISAGVDSVLEGSTEKQTPHEVSTPIPVVVSDTDENKTPSPPVPEIHAKAEP
jgi:hypothetical protein